MDEAFDPLKVLRSIQAVGQFDELVGNCFSTLRESEEYEKFGKRVEEFLTQRESEDRVKRGLLSKKELFSFFRDSLKKSPLYTEIYNFVTQSVQSNEQIYSTLTQEVERVVSEMIVSGKDAETRADEIAVVDEPSGPTDFSDGLEDLKETKDSKLQLDSEMKDGERDLKRRKLAQESQSHNVQEWPARMLHDNAILLDGDHLLCYRHGRRRCEGMVEVMRDGRVFLILLSLSGRHLGEYEEVSQFLHAASDYARRTITIENVFVNRHESDQRLSYLLATN